MLTFFLLGAKSVAINALFWGVKFGLEDLLRVKVLTFRNSGGSGQTGKSGESEGNREHAGSELVLKTFRGDTDFEVMQGGVTEQLAVSRATKPC